MEYLTLWVAQGEARTEGTEQCRRLFDNHSIHVVHGGRDPQSPRGAASLRENCRRSVASRLSHVPEPRRTHMSVTGSP